MARSFDGSNAQIAFTLNANQKDLTQISMHYRAKRGGGGEGGYGVISSIATTSSRRFHIENDNGDAGWGIVFKGYHATSEGAWSMPYPTNNIWYDYVLTYDHSSTVNDPIWYKDGVPQTITERVGPSGAATSNDNNLYIGSDDVIGQTWNGELCEYAIWNRILSPSEAARLGAGHSPESIPGGLVFYDKMTGDLNPEVDVIGGITGTITGTAQTSHPTVLYPDMITKNFHLKQGFQ